MKILKRIFGRDKFKVAHKDIECLFGYHKYKYKEVLYCKKKRGVIEIEEE